MRGFGQVVVSLLISVLMLGHKVGTVNGIVNSVNRRKEIDEVLGQLEGSQSQLPPGLVKHARRLTLRDGDDDLVQVLMVSVGACVWEGCRRAKVHTPRAGGCVHVSPALRCRLNKCASAVMAGSACAKEEHRTRRKPNGSTDTCGRAVTDDAAMAKRLMIIRAARVGQGAYAGASSEPGSSYQALTLPVTVLRVPSAVSGSESPCFLC